jgi:hypothetical protein
MALQDAGDAEGPVRTTYGVDNVVKLINDRELSVMTEQEGAQTASELLHDMDAAMNPPPKIFCVK